MPHLAEGLVRRDSEYRVGTPDPVLIFEFAVTTWCNYRCDYCVTPVHAHRPASLHAFDCHPVERWIAAFQAIPFDFSVLCRGGEPFLDHEGFGRFLADVGAMPRLKYMRVDTNGSWSPDRYEGVPPEVRRNVQLNVSFHPTQITRDQFKRRLGRILDAGWQVGMINYVMEAHQAAEYEAVRDDLQGQFGVYVNPNPDAFDTSLASPMPGAHRDARRRLALLLPPADAERKTWAPTTGKSCFFPSIAYFISPNGAAERACGVKAAGPPRIDFIRDSAQVVPLPAPVRCPMPACLCLDRYAFLEELPERGRSLNLLAEYVRDCRTHQHEMSRNVGSRDIECPPWRPPG